MNISFTKEQIEEMTRCAINEVRPKIAARAVELVGYEINNQITEVVRGEIKAVINDEFKKTLNESLLAARPQIAEQAVAAAAGLAKVMAESMITAATATMADNWKRKQALKALLDG